jgi:hypothetical protein
MMAASLWTAYHLAMELEKCERAIAEYAEDSISGTVHDVEHHQMRDEIGAKLREQILLCVTVIHRRRLMFGG